jgi:excisionase family DNA binding protein
MAAMNDMDTLLTARQLQDLLQVDRITIYRMLNDGRLQGFKVGGQWRFSRQAIEAWLQEQQASLEVAGSPVNAGDARPSPHSLPLNCIQAIQGIFAEALGVGAITAAVDGTPLTTISNSCEFCDLVLSTTAGNRRCISSWQAAATGSDASTPQIAVCHAGLNYVWGRIKVQGQHVGATHAGQFLLRPPGSDGWPERIADLSAATGIDAGRLRAALASVPVLDDRRQEQIPRLLQRVVDTFSEIGEERLALLGRLQRIAEMTRY